MWHSVLFLSIFYLSKHLKKAQTDYPIFVQQTFCPNKTKKKSCFIPWMYRRRKKRRAIKGKVKTNCTLWPFFLFSNSQLYFEGKSYVITLAYEYWVDPFEIGSFWPWASSLFNSNKTPTEIGLIRSFVFFLSFLPRKQKENALIFKQSATGTSVHRPKGIAVPPKAMANR